MPRRIVVHSLDQARAALAAAAALGAPVVLQSAPAAAGYLGPAGFLALVRLAGGGVDAVVDCGAAPGHALAALRAGARHVSVTAAPAVMDKLSDMARQYGAVVAPPEPALDLEALPEAAWVAACRDWLSE